MLLEFLDIPLIVNGQIQLPASKSISNRLQMLRAYSKKDFVIHNLSEAEDTIVLKNILDNWNSEHPERKFNVGHAGTAMRFLTAFFAAQLNADVELWGSERMHKRPINILVEALDSASADIQYLNKINFPPLRIKGKDLNIQEKLFIDGNVSSQYISALLLMGVYKEKGIELELLGNVTSEPYIDMTLSLIDYFGIKTERNFNHIKVYPSTFIPKDITVESDWSAASYFFSLLSLAKEGQILLKNLTLNSLQGDMILINHFEKFGIELQAQGEDLLISKGKMGDVHSLHFDLINSPDLAQTLVVCAAGLKINASFSGLETLKIKETNRIKALQVELRKFNVDFKQHNEIYTLDCSRADFTKEVIIETYKDHRMAMAFAPLALLNSKIKISDPEVVKKSYPGFWSDLNKLGIKTIMEHGS